MSRLLPFNWFRLGSEPWHPSEDDILLYLDGELPERRMTRVRDHLEACWACRARSQRLQEAITEFAEFAAGPLSERMPTPPANWSTFGAMLRNEKDSSASVASNTDAARNDHRPPFLLSVPALATTIAALVVAVLAILSFDRWTPTVSAAQLLDQVHAADTQLIAQPGIVLHRVLRLDARRLPDGPSQSRGRVEVWQSAERGLKARRYYDQQGRLVAGEWRLDAGTRTLYRPGEPPDIKSEAPAFARETTPGELRLGKPLTASYVWLWDATAEDFLRLVGRDANARVTQDRDRYDVSYAPANGGSGGTLVRARLTIAKSDLHIISQTLVLRDQDGLVEFSLNEARRETTSGDRVGASVFEPDPVLTAAALPPPTPVASPKPVVSAAKGAPVVDAVDPSAIATLEIEAAHGLHVAGIHLPDNANITAARDGNLVVDVTVTDETRKDLITRRLATLTENPKIRLVVAVNPAETARAPTGDTLGRAPGLALVTRHLERNSAGALDRATLDRTARLFAHWALDQSAVRLRSAEALRYITDRHSLEMLSRLELESLVMWQSMVRDHVREIARDSESLRAQLEPILLAEIGGGVIPREDVRAIQDLKEVPDAVKTLVETLKAQDTLVQQLFRAGSLDAIGDQVVALAQSFSKLDQLINSFSGPWWLGR